MTNGRYSQGNRALIRETFYGADGAASVTTLPFNINGQIVSFVSWNPGFPSACKATRVHVTNEVAVDTNPGNWTLNLYKNESLTVAATFSFTTGAGAKFKTAGYWSNSVHFDAGETYWISAAGPAKNTVICRVSLEFEVY